MQFRVSVGYTFINSEKAFTQSECYKIQSASTVWVVCYGSIISNYRDLYLIYWDCFSTTNQSLNLQINTNRNTLTSFQAILTRKKYVAPTACSQSLGILKQNYPLKYENNKLDTHSR